MGLCPLTPAEIEKELKKFAGRRASEEEIDRIISAVTRGELPEVEEPPLPDWTPDCDYQAMDRETVLFRNPGEESPEAARREEELLKDLFADDDQENGRKRLAN
jgi:hypothetical protein